MEFKTWTVEFKTKFPGNYNGMLFSLTVSNYGEAGTRRLFLRYEASFGGPAFGAKNSSQSDLVTPIAIPTLCPSVWNHVSIVKKTGWNIEIYVNGKLAGTITTNLSTISDSDSAMFGNYMMGGSFDSTFKDIVVWKVAMPPLCVDGLGIGSASRYNSFVKTPFESFFNDT